MRLTEKRIAAALKHHGHKLTPQRRVVIGAIAASRGQLTPATLYRKVHREHPAIGLTTVYRTLEILNHLGLICELHTGGNGRSYTTGAPEHHHHLICTSCGAVVDFSGYHLTQLEAKLSRETGFEIEGHLLEFTGQCRNCRQNA
jgi:Fur family ferric uptake transcriptional regulator